VANKFFYNDQVLDWFKDNLKQETSLGFNFVDYGNVDDLIPGYPAALLSPGPRTRVVHATHIFLVTFIVDIWVLHGNLNVGYSQRKKEDIQLCNAVQDFMDKHFSLDTPDNVDNIIFGRIENETPGAIVRSGSPIVSTRLQWSGTSEQPFD
jgi:uncharacterized protein YneR